MQRLVALLVLWGGLLIAATAGVVEDAEEALKNVPSDRPYQAATSGAAQDPGHRFPTRASSVSYGATSSSRPGGQASSVVNRIPSKTSRDLGGSATSSADPTPDAQNQAARRRSAQESKDLALSFAGVLVLLFFVAMAGYYSRRVSGNSD